MKTWIGPAAIFAVAFSIATSASAQDDASRLTFRILPAPRVQLAVWVESDDGANFRTVLLTSSVSRYGIGNRPGALVMNSGFHWPYGRREGVLPVWAHRRVDVGRQAPFRRVIFRDRQSEGDASQASAGTFPTESYRDNPDPYFCLSFNSATTRRDALDAVGCASTYSSDRGRYITASEAGHYSEPYTDPFGATSMYALGATSLYPPRMDVECAGSCPNHPDTLQYAADARLVLPELDAVSMSTLPDVAPTEIMFTVPTDWPAGTYHAYVEANTEGDYNTHYDGEATGSPLGTPTQPTGSWDSWAISYGYPYRGQPSVVYRIDFTLPAAGMMDTYSALVPVGHGSVDGRGGSDTTMYPMSDGTISDDPTHAPGSGADRLRALAPTTSDRVGLTVYSPHFCDGATPPAPITNFLVTPVADEKHSHEYAHLSFTVPSTSRPISRYDVRVSTAEIHDEASFNAGMSAYAATIDNIGLSVPTTGAPGTTVDVDMGHLAPLTVYYVGIRSRDQCFTGPIAVGMVTTTAIHFTTVSPCFVATATYGTPMAGEIGALRRFRDRHLETNAVGRALVDAYYAHGPALADVVREHASLRAAARAVIGPLVSLARALDED